MVNNIVASTMTTSTSISEIMGEAFVVFLSKRNVLRLSFKYWFKFKFKFDCQCKLRKSHEKVKVNENIREAKFSRIYFLWNLARRAFNASSWLTWILDGDRTCVSL